MKPLTQEEVDEIQRRFRESNLDDRDGCAMWTAFLFGMLATIGFAAVIFTIIWVVTLIVK